MRLFIALPTEAARLFIERGFAGIPRVLYDADATLEEVNSGKAKPTGVAEYVEFRDQPPVGLTLSRTAEVTEAEIGDDSMAITIGGGPVLADDLGDFILSIDVPDEVALAHEAKEDPPSGWPFREFWLPPEVANTYRHTLKAFDSNDGRRSAPTWSASSACGPLAGPWRAHGPAAGKGGTAGTAAGPLRPSATRPGTCGPGRVSSAQQASSAATAGATSVGAPRRSDAVAPPNRRCSRCRAGQ
jgi:hypothetical protein